MPRSFGEPLTKLRAVPIQENGEPLVDPRTLSRRIHFAQKHPKFEDMPRTPRVRRGVAERLAYLLKFVRLFFGGIETFLQIEPAALQAFLHLGDEDKAAADG